MFDKDEALGCVIIVPGSEPDSRIVRVPLLEMLSRPAERPAEYAPQVSEHSLIP